MLRSRMSESRLCRELTMAERDTLHLQRYTPKVNTEKAACQTLLQCTTNKHHSTVPISHAGNGNGSGTFFLQLYIHVDNVLARQVEVSWIACCSSLEQKTHDLQTICGKQERWQREAYICMESHLHVPLRCLYGVQLLLKLHSLALLCCRMALWPMPATSRDSARSLHSFER